MSIFKRKIKEEKDIKQEQNNNRQDDVKIKDFDSYIYERIEEMKLKMARIEMFMPERAMELKQIVEDLEKSIIELEELRAETEIKNEIEQQEILLKEIKSNSVSELTFEPKDDVRNKKVKMQLYFDSKSKIFDIKYRMINQEYLMKCAENLEKRIGKVIYVENPDIFKEHTTKELEEDFIQYYKQLIAKQEEFSGLQKNLYITVLKNIRYRLKQLEAVQMPKSTKKLTDYIESWKNERTEADKILESRLIIEDISRIKNEFKNLRKEYEAKGIILEDDDEEKIKKLEEQIDVETLSDVKDISEDTIQDLIEIMISYREYKMSFDRKLEAKQGKSRREKTKEKERDIRKKLEKINMKNGPDYTTACREIFEYEKEILEQEGLLTKENLMQTENIITTRIKKSEILERIIRLHGNTNYSICVDAVDDNIYRESCYLIYPSGSVHREYVDILKFSRGEFKRGRLEQLKVDMLKEEGKGKYTNDVLCYLMYKYGIKTFEDKDWDGTRTDYVYTLLKKDEKILQEDLKKIQDEYPIDNIKFSIQVPYTRPLLSILEELKENGIEYYIFQNKGVDEKREGTKKVYMNRADLEKYKEKVHPIISNVDDGVVIIGEEKVDLAEYLLDGSKNIEFFKEDENIK